MGYTTDRPIFLIGAPKSGTTVVFEALSFHRDLAWLPHFSNRMADPPLDLLAGALRWPLSGLGRGVKKQRQGGISHLNRLRPRPDECYPVWERVFGSRFRRDYLIGQRATPREAALGRALISRQVWIQNRRRFTAKLTGPTRIEYLSSVFPDALFVHIIRDGRAVAGSLIETPFWIRGGGLERAWWQNGLPEGWEAEWERFDRDPAVLAAIQWRRIIEVARRESQTLPPERYCELRYEEFAVDPAGALEALQDFCGLPRCARVARALARGQRIESHNERCLRRLSPGQRQAVERTLARTLWALGYKSAPARGPLAAPPRVAVALSAC